MLYIGVIHPRPTAQLEQELLPGYLLSLAQLRGVLGLLPGRPITVEVRTSCPNMQSPAGQILIASVFGLLLIRFVWGNELSLTRRVVRMRGFSSG